MRIFRNGNIHSANGYNIVKTLFRMSRNRTVWQRKHILFPVSICRAASSVPFPSLIKHSICMELKLNLFDIFKWLEFVLLEGQRCCHMHNIAAHAHINMNQCGIENRIYCVCWFSILFQYSWQFSPFHLLSIGYSSVQSGQGQKQILAIAKKWHRWNEYNSETLWPRMFTNSFSHFESSHFPKWKP